MKSLQALAAILILLCAVPNALAQNSKELSPGYYVVIAAFSPTKEILAERYTDVLKKRGLTAAYGFNSHRKYYYVYLNRYNELPPSLQNMLELRKQEEFGKTWVRIVRDDLTSYAAQQTITANDPKPTEPKEPEKVLATEPVAQPLAVAETQSVPDTSYNSITDNPEIVQFEKITLENTEVFLSLFNARNNKIVEGSVKVVDTEKAKLIKEVPGNDYLYLPNPGNKTGTVTLICEAFGYRKIQHELNYPLPLSDTIKEHVDLMGTTFIVNFDLVRYHIGDVATLYHVYFYNDAAVMLPESKFELTSLLEMMQEDPNYRVKLHGHTNGNYHGKIILMGDQKNFFSLTGSKNTMGSAKDLAYERANSIREYLVANGIEGTRIEIKSWGGKKPIYDKHSANAKRNVRVEVEILQK
jgi:outer membrane protein OmpA-like peptidoglycan-associated protein